MLLGIRWGSLRAKIIAWSFVPAAIILTAVAGVAFASYRRVTKDLVIERNQQLIRSSAVGVSTQLAGYATLLTEYAGALANLPRTAYAYEGDVIVLSGVLERAQSRFAVFDGGVVVLNERGIVVATEPDRPGVEGQDWSNRQYYRQLLRSPSPLVSDVVADGPQWAEVVVVAVPIQGDQGQFLGVIAGMFTLGPAATNDLYRDIDRLCSGTNSSIYLVDSIGRVIFHSDATRIREDFAAQAEVQRVLNGEVDAIRTRSFSGQDIVAGFAPVPGTPWGLVTEETWANLTRGYLGYQNFLLFLLVLGVMVPAIVVNVGVRRITKPIIDLMNAAQEVAKGNFGQTIAADTGDEIEELARQFNLMSAQLQESYAHLEQRVADRTRELATINAIAEVVSRSLDLDEILCDALDETLAMLDVEAGAILLCEPDAEVMTPRAHRGFSPEFVEAVPRVHRGEGSLVKP